MYKSVETAATKETKASASANADKTSFFPHQDKHGPRQGFFGSSMGLMLFLLS